MQDNKVSEKAIWEGSISPDDETSITASPIQTQPQMMFCYKCNNVIPSNSNYCPYCQVKLFTECPKCGVKYSFQYPSCSQCGTNRLEYLQSLKKEQERIERLKREERIRQEKLERERLEKERKQKEAEAEKERQERLKRYEQEATERQQKEEYLKENAEIMKTKEYEMTYSLVNEAFEDYEKRADNMGCIIVPLCVIIIMVILFFVSPPLGFILMIVSNFWGHNLIDNKNKCKKQLQKYISSNNKHNNPMFTSRFINMISYQGKERLSDCCIIAYREKHGLAINYKWHSLK